MKKEIHPAYYPEAKITCACGHSFNVGSTVKEISVEICSVCHPFYTGKQKFIDTAHRVDRFKRIQEKSQALKTTRKKVKKPTKTKKAKKESA